MTRNALLTPRQVLERVGMKSLKTIRRWRKAGKLPFKEISKNVYRYRREDVEALIDSQTEPRPTERAQDIEAHVLAQVDKIRDRIEGRC